MTAHNCLVEKHGKKYDFDAKKSPQLVEVKHRTKFRLTVPCEMIPN